MHAPSLFYFTVRALSFRANKLLGVHRRPPVPERQPLGPSAMNEDSVCFAQGLFLASGNCQQGATWEVGSQVYT